MASNDIYSEEKTYDHDPLTMEIGERIRVLREAASLNQTQLGDIVDVSKNQVSRWETGVNRPSYESLQKLCNYFTTTSDFLLFGNNGESEKVIIRSYLAYLEEQKKSIERKIAIYSDRLSD